MSVAPGLSIQTLLTLILDDAGIVVQLCLIRVRLDKDLVIQHDKATFRHSAEHFRLQQRYEGERHPVGKHPILS